MKNITLLLTIVFASLQIGAAQRTLRGIVKDEKGEPLMGATVQIVGTNKSTITDTEGRFSIIGIPIEATKIKCSINGYPDKEQIIGASNYMEFSLSKKNIIEDQDKIKVEIPKKKRKYPKPVYARIDGIQMLKANNYFYLNYGADRKVILNKSSNEPCNETFHWKITEKGKNEYSIRVLKTENPGLFVGHKIVPEIILPGHGTVNGFVVLSPTETIWIFEFLDGGLSFRIKARDNGQYICSDPHNATALALCENENEAIQFSLDTPPAQPGFVDWDFESAELTGWTSLLNGAFDKQPEKGDLNNGHEGNGWISTNDIQQGVIYSLPIQGRYAFCRGGKFLNFLISGSKDINSIYVALMKKTTNTGEYNFDFPDGKYKVLVDSRSTGNGLDYLRRASWDLEKLGISENDFFRILIFEGSTSGHINIDHFHFDKESWVGKDEVWGFADLHTHPMSHLAWGDPGNGRTFFWGNPGGAVDENEAVAYTKSLPPCNGHNHSMGGADLLHFDDQIREATRSEILNLNLNKGGYFHAREGNNNFKNWPNARSPMHQQMHIKWLHRAYIGGLRLIIASAVDNHVIAKLWNNELNEGSSNYNKPLFGENEKSEFDYRSAIKQIKAMEELSNQNSSWMKICTTAQQARDAVLKENKLAVIIGVEMDFLSENQMIDLIDNFKVRSVIPIHLADNTYGGSAIYDDVFNTNNYALNNSFYEVEIVDYLTFKLKKPKKIVPMEPTEKKNEFFVGLADVAGWIWGDRYLNEKEFSELCYCKEYCNDNRVMFPENNKIGGENPSYGMRNKKGANTKGIERLMRKNILLDVSHMSEKAHNDVFQLARQNRYPLINSHTGLRNNEDAMPDDHERAMRASDARIMSDLGGVMGLGLGGNSTLSLTDLISKESFIKAPPLALVNTEKGINKYSFKHIELASWPDKDLKVRSFLVNSQGWRGIFDSRIMVDSIVLYDKSNNSHKFLSYQYYAEDYICLKNSYISLANIQSIHFFFSYSLYEFINVTEEPLFFKLKLFAINDKDPIDSWMSNFTESSNSISKIAFGSDFNGLDNLLPYTAYNVNYPINYSGVFSDKFINLGKMIVGNKHFILNGDGLSNIGLYPDFIQVISQQGEGGKSIVRSLFKSCEHTLRAWEEAELAAYKMNNK